MKICEFKYKKSKIEVIRKDALLIVKYGRKKHIVNPFEFQKRLHTINLVEPDQEKCIVLLCTEIIEAKPVQI